MFSKTYLRQPAGANQDSKRLRNRLAMFAEDVSLRGRGTSEFVKLVRTETGALVPNDIEDFFRAASLRDVLDAISCMTIVLRNGYPRVANDWIAFCKRAFEEEGMAYRIDDNGDAHYVVDLAFHEMADAVVETPQRNY